MWVAILPIFKSCFLARVFSLRLFTQLMSSRVLYIYTMLYTYILLIRNHDFNIITYHVFLFYTCFIYLHLLTKFHVLSQVLYYKHVLLSISVTR